MGWSGTPQLWLPPTTTQPGFSRPRAAPSAHGSDHKAKQAAAKTTRRGRGMSAGNSALIARVPGLGLMLSAAQASRKIKGPGLDLIRRTIASVELVQLSSNRDSPELRCSSASKQQTPQDSSQDMAETENAVPSVPGGTERAPRTLASTAGHKTRLVPAAREKGPAVGKPRAVSQAAGPGGELRARDKERGQRWDRRDAGPRSIACRTTA